MRLGVLVSALLLCVAVRAGDAPPAWKVLPHAIPRPAAPAASPSTKQIDAWIDALRRLSKQQEGLSAWLLAGAGFPEAGDKGPFAQLVRAGPAALPAILAHLEDKRQTKLRFQDQNSPVVFGGLVKETELPVPYGRTKEERSLRAAFSTGAVDTDWGHAAMRLERCGPHTVTVGDCCFAILGGIVNRPYCAVRTQPTAIVVINSPTDQPKLAAAVRAYWGAGDPRAALEESLLDDLYTRGSDSGPLQSGAARRLLAWFPKVAAPLVAARVRDLHWGDFHQDWAAYYSPHFLAAVLDAHNDTVDAAALALLDPARPSAELRRILGAFPAPARKPFRARIREILAKTDDPAVRLTCLRLLPETKSEKLYAELQGELQAAVARGRSGDQRVQKILGRMAAMDPVKSEPIFQAFLEKHGDGGKVDVLYALEGSACRTLILAIVPPLLRDRRTVPDNSEGRRFCDFAADVLSQARSDLHFAGNAGPLERDDQIEAISRALGMKRREHDLPRREVAIALSEDVKGALGALAVDPKHHCILLAAEASGMVEEIHRGFPDSGWGEGNGARPHDVLFLAVRNQLLVTDRSLGLLTVCSRAGQGFKEGLRDIKLGPDPGEIRYAGRSRIVYVGYGSGALARFRVRSWRRLRDFSLDGHPAGFAVEDATERIFVDIPEKREVEVLDGKTGKVADRFQLSGEAAGPGLALDAESHRVFVGCKQPPRLLVLDADTGKAVASLPCPKQPGDIEIDGEAGLVYVTCGEGVVAVFRPGEKDAFERAGSLPTGPGAQTSYFSPSDHRLYVAVPSAAVGTRVAQVLVFQTPEK